MSRTPSIAAAAAIVITSLWLSGCQASNQLSGDVKLKSDSVNGAAQTTTSDSTLETSRTTASSTSQGATMKQLADFTPIEATQATLVTSKGEITIELYRDQAPVTTLNFLSLAKDGFYDGIVFHRVIADFMAQVGDPLTKDPSQEAAWGTGGPGYVIPDEFDANLTHDAAGVVSMANRGPNTGGSQFFITFAATPWLDGKHAIFGRVTQGMDVVNQLQQGDTIESIRVE